MADLGRAGRGRPFADRRHAGLVLAGLLVAYQGRDDVVVLALPRGGVPVGYEVARVLGVPLDIVLVRKLGVPGDEELAMGAVATGGAAALNESLIRRLGIAGDVIRQQAAREAEALLGRERAYRRGRPPPDLAGRVVILVDDGLATGSSMRAAIAAVGGARPARMVVAVPVGPEPACEDLAGTVDEVVCARSPAGFFAVGESYTDFRQITDQEVEDLLDAGWSSRPGPGAPDSPNPQG